VASSVPATSVLKLFGPISPWRVAVWFESTNAWLGNHRPQSHAAGSKYHPTGTQVRSFLSHLLAPTHAPRPHREGASGD
jgi:hypothetical protein